MLNSPLIYALFNNIIKILKVRIIKLYHISVKNISGNDVSLGEYKGKGLLIVNTATKCGFTPQYEGFEILDFPCNQFANQAPGSDAEIDEFCPLNYDTIFPRFKKIDVNGEN